MNILILSQYFWPENFRINDLAVELADRGHDVTVLTGVPNYPQGRVYADFRENSAAFARLDKVEIVRVPMLARGKGYLRLSLNYLSFALSASCIGPWKLRSHQFDHILVFQISPGTIGLPGVLFRTLKRAKLIFWVQDLWPETLGAIGAIRSPLLLGIVGMFMGWVYQNTDHLLAQSRSFIPHLRQRAPETLPISYLPNWANVHACHERSHRSAASRRTFDIYYLGNLGEAQGFPAILQAIQALAEDDVRWHFVGNGSMEQWMKREVTRRGLEEVVCFSRMVPAEEVSRFYSEADALLVSLKPDPLFAMTVPSKIQTYLAAGLPIVAMLDGEGARVMEESGAGVVCPAGDGGALVEAVQRLRSRSPATRAEMGLAGMRYYHEQFHFPRVVDQLESLLIELPATHCAALDG